MPAKRWTVRNLDSHALQVLRAKSTERGLTMGQLLTEIIRQWSDRPTGDPRHEGEGRTPPQSLSELLGRMFAPKA